MAGVTAVEPKVVAGEETVVAGVTAVEPEVVTGEEAVVAGVTAVEPEVMAGEEAVVAGVTAVEPEVVAREEAVFAETRTAEREIMEKVKHRVQGVHACMSVSLVWPHPIPQEREGLVTCFTAVGCVALHSQVSADITANYKV